MTREERIQDQARDYGDSPEDYRKHQPVWIAIAAVIFIAGCIIGGTILATNLVSIIQNLIEKI